MNEFYRYQDTDKIEHNSRYVDLNMMKEDLENIEKPISKEDLNSLFNKFYSSLDLRANILAKDLFNLVLKSDTNEVDCLCDNYPVNGIFGFFKDEIDNNYLLNELLEEVKWNCYGDKYLLLYEGEELLDEGDLGIIFNPIKIKKIWNVKVNKY